MQLMRNINLNAALFYSELGLRLGIKLLAVGYRAWYEVLLSTFNLTCTSNISHVHTIDAKRQFLARSSKYAEVYNEPWVKLRPHQQAQSTFHPVESKPFSWFVGDLHVLAQSG